MITIEVPEIKKTYLLKSAWKELSQADFIYLSGLYLRYINNDDIDPLYVQMRFFMYLLKYKQTKKDYTEIENDKIRENIAFLSSKLSFIFSTENGEIIPDLDYRRFFVSEIKLNNEIIQGSKFEITSDGLISCDITTEQFINAFNFYNAFSKSNSNKLLEFIAACFFAPMKQKDDPDYIIKNHSKYKRLGINTLFAIFMQFSGLLHYITEKSVYTLLFGKTESNNKLSLGLAETVYSLVKSNYGTKDEISKLLLFDYLNVLLKEKIDSVKQLKELGKKVHEIAKITGLSIDDVNTIV